MKPTIVYEERIIGRLNVILVLMAIGGLIDLVQRIVDWLR